MMNIRKNIVSSKKRDLSDNSKAGTYSKNPPEKQDLVAATVILIFLKKTRTLQLVEISCLTV